MAAPNPPLPSPVTAAAACLAATMSPSPVDPALERSFRGHKDTINSVAFNPNMKQLVSGGEDACVMVWNFKMQLRAFRFVGHKAAVHSVACSPSGDLIASGSKDRSVRLWLPTVRGENSVLTIRGAGVSPLGGDGDGDGAANDGAALGDIDRSRWIGYRPTPTLPPATPFQLSTHACAFGEIPSLAIVRRVVALTSCSDFDYDFKWNLCALAGNETIGALAIEPAEGVLNRGESVMIKVIFTAGTDPRVFDGAVRCELTPTTPSREELEYEARLAEEAKTRPVAVAEQGAPAPSMPTKLEKQGKSEVWVSYASKERRSKQRFVGGGRWWVA